MDHILKYKSSSELENGIIVNCDINIPIEGDEATEIYDKRMDSLRPMLTAQYLNAIKEVLSDYEQSSLPQRFIENQKILICDLLETANLDGVIDRSTDIMIVDANTLSGMSDKISPSFLFGYLMGSKIAKYKATPELYGEIFRTLDLLPQYNNDKILKEIYAEECGVMVDPKIVESTLLPPSFDKKSRENMKMLILENAHR